MAKYEWWIERRMASGVHMMFVGDTPLEACALALEKTLELDYPGGSPYTRPYITGPVDIGPDDVAYGCYASLPNENSGFNVETVYRRPRSSSGGDGGKGNGGASGTDPAEVGCLRFLLPDEAGFGWTVKKHVLYAELEGGPPRIRSDFVGITTTVNAAWTVRKKDIDRIIGILESSASMPTNVWLFLDGAVKPTMNLCRLIPGTLRVSTIGLSTRISCSLEAEPAPEDFDWPVYE